VRRRKQRELDRGQKWASEGHSPGAAYYRAVVVVFRQDARPGIAGEDGRTFARAALVVGVKGRTFEVLKLPNGEC
jgi:hypothetical protein